MLVIIFIFIFIVVAIRAGVSVRLLFCFLRIAFIRLPAGEKLLLEIKDPLVLEDLDQRDSLILVFL